MTYKEQIKHPKWQKKRLEVLKHYKWTCKKCGSKDKQLHVHHPFYRRGAMIWEYKKEELVCLCHDCHTAAHPPNTHASVSSVDEQAEIEAFMGKPTGSYTADDFFEKMRLLLSGGD